MANLLRVGAEFLEQQRKAFNSETVTYRRGSQSIPVLATIAATEYEQMGIDGVTVGGEIVDFLIAAADLDFGSGSVFPEYGDEIVVAGRGTFRALQTPDGGVYRFSDPFGNTLRIHTKFIG